MPASFGGEFRSSQTKMDWKYFKIINAHDSLHHLLPVKGVSTCEYVKFVLFMSVQTIEVLKHVLIFQEFYHKCNSVNLTLTLKQISVLLLLLPTFNIIKYFSLCCHVMYGVSVTCFTFALTSNSQVS